MKKARLAVLCTLVVVALGAFLSLLVPVPAGVDRSEFYFNFSVSIATLLLYIGGSVVSVMGFGAFTSKLRRPYKFIFAGLILWGVAFLQLPLMILFNLLNNNVAISLSAIPFIASAVLLFVGTKMLARLFAVTNKATSWWFALGLIAAISVVMVIVPHGHTQSKEIDFDMANVLIMTATTLFGMGAYHILLIKGRASAAFTDALAWLFLSMLISAAIAGLGSTLLAIIAGSSASQIVIILALAPSCVAAAFFLRSGYSFNKIVDAGDVQGLSVARNFFGKPLKPRSQEEAVNSIDIVVYAAGLASKPTDLDALLDGVRAITSRLKSGMPLTDQDEQTLLNIYLKVEEYLLTKESLRVFTRDSLRQDIAQKLRLSADAAGTFWSKLGTNEQQTPPQAAVPSAANPA